MVSSLSRKSISWHKVSWFDGIMGLCLRCTMQEFDIGSFSDLDNDVKLLSGEIVISSPTSEVKEDLNCFISGKASYRAVPPKSTVSSRFRPSAVDRGRKKKEKKREKNTTRALLFLGSLA
ncbi:hypothetical protein B296_00058454 [Ensete ventricosum]|uniref:Uncharacterized protein n=1 Tax=Ensete ventricosum TaxID=4639 RepID=A0A426WYW1_ENSVE|nr:hypothetical protein B296_00058454 [Ensete ventricosum]